MSASLESSLRFYTNRLIQFGVRTQDYITAFIADQTSIDEEIDVMILDCESVLRGLESEFRHDLPSVFGNAIDELERVVRSRTFTGEIANKTYSGNPYIFAEVVIDVPAMRDVGELLFSEGQALLRLVETACEKPIDDIGVDAEDTDDEYSLQDDIDALGGLGFRVDDGEYVPDQELAPATFSFEGTRIRVSHKPISSDPGDEAVLEKARARLTVAMSRLIQTLKGTNCDPRLLGEFEVFQDDIDQGVDVIALGMQYRSIEMTVSALGEEVSDFVGAKIHGFGHEVAAFLAQSPDWRTFVEKADATSLPAEAEPVARKTLDVVIDQLDQSFELADPEVPATLKFMREMLKHPKRAGLRVVYGAIRSVENLAKAILAKGQEEVVNVGAATIASSILSQLGPIAASTPWLAWMLKVHLKGK